MSLHNLCPDMALHLATLALGERHDVLARAWYAILSVLAHGDPQDEMAIVTDRPERFAWFGDRLMIHAVDAATVAAWTKGGSYFFRAKAEALALLARRSERPVVLIDSDTVLRRPLTSAAAALAAGRGCMHVLEKDLARATRPGDRRVWRDLRGGTYAGHHLTDSAPMWNSGVIGVPAGQGAAIAAEACVVMDALIERCPGFWTAEQMAFSLVLGRLGPITGCGAEIDHYYGNKPGYDPAIDAFLAGLLLRGAGVDEAVEAVRSAPIRLPVMVRRRRWQQVALRLIGVPIRS